MDSLTLNQSLYLVKNIINVIAGLFLLMSLNVYSQDHTIAREWNEQLLAAIRGDFARPTVHARNLFHLSAAMYDAWAVFDTLAQPYFLGNDIRGFTIEFDGFTPMESIEQERNEAISYAAYRLIRYRFRFAPDGFNTLLRLDEYMDELGFDRNYNSTDYSNGDGRALGNYIAEKIIEFGLQDGSNEIDDFNNLYYEPTNEPLVMAFSGNPTIQDPNRWQPLTLDIFIDQAGNEIPFDTPDFLSPEWGNVIPFALSEDGLNIYPVDDNEYWVYNDPGPPPYIDSLSNEELQDYQWGFMMVAQWSSHLDPSDSILWDISPGALGNVAEVDLPLEFAEMRDFYDEIDGGDIGKGYNLNPVTGEPYEPNIVPRGDYTRVLAEFWADGPESETPPGHWFTIMNYVNDQPSLVRSYRAQTEILDPLEWDIKCYFILGGAMHDCAISSWGIKGYYDYPRPVSAIRYMAEKGQSTDSSQINYNKEGLPLIEGFSELVKEGDELEGENGEHIGEVKIYAWRGPDFISNPRSDVAGVGWILAKDWWPYQRPSFVSPPFAGYISGHSTFSRAAAEVLTKITGSEFFPGGIGEFVAPKNEFLVFEDGPSQDIILQWATYRDASDQTSLSRIWGGIHPPQDDIPGRIIGIKIADDAVQLAEEYFNVTITNTNEITQLNNIKTYPNPISPGQDISIDHSEEYRLDKAELYNPNGGLIMRIAGDRLNKTGVRIPEGLAAGNYYIVIYTDDQILMSTVNVINP